MRRFLTTMAVAILTALPAFSQTTSITATHIAQDVSGTLLASGKLCAVPVSQATGQVTGFEVSGTQYLPQMACTTVTNGAISGFTLPDSSLSSPVVGFKLSVTDPTGKAIYNYPQPIYPFSTTFNLDTWTITESAVIANPTTVSRGNNAPQGRCGNAPAIYYTELNEYHCWDQIWLVVTGSGGGTVTSSAINSALGFTPVSNTQLSAAISAAIAAIPSLQASDISTALSYVPVSPSDLASAIAAIPAITSSQITTALGYVPVSPSQLAAAVSTAATPTFDLASGTYTSVQSLNLSDTTTGATISYCVMPTGNCTPNIVYGSTLSISASETVCANAVGASGGVLSATACTSYVINTGSPSGPTATGIGTVIDSGYLTDGSVAYKTCSQFPGAVCNGGVGTNVPSSSPTHTFGLNTPSASTGLSNKVGNFHLETAIPGASGTQFTMALWTTTGGGIGVNATATNFYVGGWIKTSYPAGPSRIEMDPYAFDSGWDWMWGFQCNSDRNLFQTANQSSSWTYTSAPCAKLFDGNYHHVELTFHRTLGADRSCGGGTAPCEVWDTVTVDGTSYALNVTMPATTSSWTGSGWQFQIDGAPTTASSGTPAKYDLWCDSCQFIAGTAASAGSPGSNGGSTTGTGDLDSFNFDSGLTIPAGLTAVGSPVISATQEHTTPNSAHFTSGLNYFTNAVNPVSTIYSRQYLYINTENLANPMTFLRYYHSGAELFVYYLSTSGTVSYFDQASGASVTAAPGPLSTGAWHLIETYTKVDPSVGHVTVKIDGTQTYDSGPINTGTTTIDTTWFGNIGNSAPTGWDTYEDNVDWDDTNWIGPI